ncbi:class I SAM-dependent methyltransferase [Streptomyces shenzhenensis]|uniref:class I SAM-dependent methyltransferase n=1 Tax=Streptomyces shenzhenensis TaxID=943815 RepID=UPI001F2380AA|nr:class I SAM-dependent methyltransferase [Streptomyces shenzhenensis]
MPKSGFFSQQLVSASVARDRDVLLLNLCAGRRVLHVGCADSPLTAEKLANGSILHAKLLREASHVHGVDVDHAGIERLRERLPGEYSVADVADPNDRSGLVKFRPEVVLAGDVIEHVRDAASFLRGLAALMREAGDGVELILSTPNGLAAKNMINTLAGLEVIHPDHVYVFTPASLARLVSDCGLRPNRWFFYHVDSGKGARARLYDGISRAAANVRSAFAEGQVLVCQSGT